MCEQGKFPLHLRPSLGQMGKHFHAGAVKPEPGFCGSGFGFFQSVRCPIRWTKVTDALGTRLVDKMHVCFKIANITHALPVPVYLQTDFTPKRVVVSCLHDTVARFRTVVKFSPR